MISTESISKLFSEFNNLSALVIGDVMVDSYIWGTVNRISPEAPVPIVEVKKRENRLRGAANVGLNLKALGATPILCSVIGNDQRGDDFISLLNIDYIFLFQRSKNIFIFWIWCCNFLSNFKIVKV